MTGYWTALTVLTRLTVLTADRIDPIDVVDIARQWGQPRQRCPQVNAVNTVNEVIAVQTPCVRRRRTLQIPTPPGGGHFSDGIDVVDIARQ